MYIHRDWLVYIVCEKTAVVKSARRVFHRSVQVEHSGDIVCKLKNHLGEATCRAKLRVAEDLSKKGECPLFVERPSDVEVTEGGEARFDCVITGTPIPEVLWYFNGRELFVSSYTVHYSCLMIIHGDYSRAPHHLQLYSTIT